MEYTQIGSFSGLNRQVSPFLTKVGEYLEVQNFKVNQVGVLEKTGDYTIKNAQITASQDIYSGHDHILAAGTHEHFVAINGSSNAEIYKDVAGTWTTQSQSLTKDYKVRFAYSPALRVTIVSNEADATRSYTAGSWSTSNYVTSAPKGKVPFYFGNRFYVLNCDISGTKYPTRIYRSETEDNFLSSPTTAWDVTNEWISFDDELVGAGRLGNHMLIAGANLVYLFTLTDDKIPISNNGAVSHESITSFSRFAFWASRVGMIAHDGGDEQNISLPIQDYWDAIPEANLPNIQAETYGHHLYVYIGDITLDGRSLKNVLLDYNIYQNNWNRMSLSEEITNLHSFITSSGRQLFAGNNDGEVFNMFTGEDQNGSDIVSFLETDWDLGSGQRFQDTWYELWGHGKKLSGLKVSYKLDNDDNEWQDIGELNGTTDVVKFRARGYRIKYLLQEVSKENLYELHLLESGYEAGHEKEFGED